MGTEIMDWLFPSIVATLIGTLVLAGTYASLYHGERKAYLGIWTLAWAVYALRFVFMLLQISVGLSEAGTFALIGNQLTSLMSGVLLLWGSCVYAGRRISVYWVYLSVGVTFYFVLEGLLRPSFFVESLPTFLFLSCIFIRTGAIFIRQKNYPGNYATTVGILFILWGLHRAGDPFLRPLEWAAPWGYMLGAALEVLVAIGMLMIYFQEARWRITESEEKYRELVERANSIILKWNRNGEIIFLNEYGLNFFGYRPEEIIGRPVVGTIVPETEDGGRNLVALMDDIFEHPAKYEKNQNENVRKNGTRAWISWTNRPIYGDDGIVVGMFSVGTDLTDQKRAEKALRESDAKMKSIFRAAPVGIGMVVDRVFQEVNTRFCEITGHSREDLIGKSVRMVYPTEEEYEKVGREKYGQILQHGTGTVETRFRRKDGGIINVLLASTPLVPKDLSAGVTFTVLDITERIKAEENARIFKTITDEAIHGNVISGLDGRIIYINDSFASAHGYAADEATGKKLSIFYDRNQKENVQKAMDTILQNESLGPTEVWQRHRNGTEFPMLMSGILLRDEDGNPKYMASSAIDITEIKRLESQLFQAQKMESVGRLAGGVAHDYNNILSVISGYAEMILENLDSGDPNYSSLLEILKAARRSEKITRQLLAFARRQTAAPEVLDLNETIESMLKMLRRMVGEDIDLAWHPKAGLWPVRIDPTQIDQILANLCVNARDAIEDVGKITIETGTAVFDEAFCAIHSYASPGEFVSLLVSDNGCGMDKRTLDNIFEPFFTTKELGRGTGLGLATVYGIVKQNGGLINVSSEPEKGTCFTIYLPRHAGRMAADELKAEAKPPSGHGEMILVVEDDAPTLNLLEQMLKGLGYNPIVSGSPPEALQLARSHCEKIKLLITDVVMPEMNGRQLVERALTFCPHLDHLFISGYAADVITNRGVLDEGINFISKPFSRRDLAIKIAQILKSN